jgi:Flp pilus assembly protein TadG
MSRLRRGQAMVELALLVPAFMMLLTGVFDFGRGAYTWSTLGYAVREGGRHAIITGTYLPNDSQVAGEIIQAAQAAGLSVTAAPCIHGQATGTLDPAPTVVNTGYVYILPGAGNTTTNAPGGQAGTSASGGCNGATPSLAGTYALKVEVVYTFGPITPFVSQFMGTSIQITANTTMSTEF